MLPQTYLSRRIDVRSVLRGTLGRVVPGGEGLHVSLELCLSLEVLLAVVVLGALVLVLLRAVVHPFVDQTRFSKWNKTSFRPVSKLL